MFGRIVQLDRQILLPHWFYAFRRTEHVDQRVCVFSGRKPTQAMFRHARRWVPKGQVDRATLVDSERPVPDLKPASSIEGLSSRHRTS